MKRVLVLAYGMIAYGMFLAVFLYLIGFVTGVVVPITVDSGKGTLGLWGNLGLVGLFGIQHTIMARGNFKKKIARFLLPAIERSTFVLVTSLILVLLFRFWSPIDGQLWNVESALVRNLLYGISVVGWVIALVSTFLINHFDLFGVRQTVMYFLGRECTPLKFKKIAFYKYVRHPLMLGFLIAFWSTPTMTFGHLCFALAMTVYILIGITFEERELTQLHGTDYTDYRRETGMLFPVGGQ